MQTHRMVQAWGMLVASGQVVAVALRDAVLKRTVLSRLPCFNGVWRGEAADKGGRHEYQVSTFYLFTVSTLHASLRHAKQTPRLFDQRALTPQHIQ